MAKTKKERVHLSRTETDTKDAEEEPQGFFDRLFNPGTIDTDVSDDENETEFDGSECSGTIYTDMTGTSASNVSDESSAESLARFDKELRAKHRSACKNMTVSVEFVYINCPVVRLPLHLWDVINSLMFSPTGFNMFLDRQICTSHKSI
jgi:hypothetical protein